MDGVAAHISVSQGADGGIGKIKILIHHDAPSTSAGARALLVSTLDAVAQQISAGVSVDRGHRHSSTRTSEICVWLRRPLHEQSAQRTPPLRFDDDRGNGDDPGDDMDDDDTNTHPRRGRSPPPSGDPWQRGADPWTAGARSAHRPQKAPRHRTVELNPKKQWRPVSKPIATSSSSCTPDPPMMRAIAVQKWYPIFSNTGRSMASVEQTQFFPTTTQSNSARAEQRQYPKHTSGDTATTNAEQTRSFSTTMQALDAEGWARIYSMFPPRGMLSAAASRRRLLLEESWHNGHQPDLYSGTLVQVEDRFPPRDGLVLRRGFGFLANFYRIQFADKTDQWVQCWLCVKKEGD